jgi:hypothetical protein
METSHRSARASHFANIDTGAAFNSKPFGVLTALQFPEMRV